jgi:EF-P beta-lysylation protein EpmB
MANGTRGKSYSSQNGSGQIGEGRADWQSTLADAVRSPAELCRMLNLDPALATGSAGASGEFPLLAPRPYLSRIRPGDPTDPLLLEILPQAAETAAKPGFDADPLGEGESLCGSGLLRKYQGRLLIVTSRACSVHCRYCFRRHFPYDKLPPDGAFSAFSSIFDEIAADRSIHEVILSGGDPLTLPDDKLAEIIAELAKIPHLRRVRIHSRMPIMIPQRIGDGLLFTLRGSRLMPIVVVQVNHPAEIDEAVAAAFRRLIDAGVPVLNQSVLLRGVNDRVDVLAELCERLIDLRVFPYYLHQLDAVAGAAHFEVPVAAGVALLAELRARLPGYAVPRYVRETRHGTSKMLLE